MAARHSEELLRTALGVPDRIAYDAKRAVRGALPEAAVRAGQVEALHAKAVGLAGWPEALERMPFAAVDHAGVFGLDGSPTARGVVSELVAGGVVPTSRTRGFQEFPEWLLCVSQVIHRFPQGCSQSRPAMCRL